MVYARVSSADRKDDPGRPVGRVAAWATQQGWRPAEVVKAIGSGLHGHRRRLRRLVADHMVGTIVVEHRARVTRFGFEYVEADPVRDATEVLTSRCAQLFYGQRSARRRAEHALAAVQAG